MDIPKFNATGQEVDRHAVVDAVSVNVTSRVPPFPLTVPPTEEKLSPEGNVPLRVIVKVSGDAPVFFTQTNFDCELPTVTFQELMISPVSEYPAAVPQLVPWATSTMAKRLLPTFTRVPVLLMERREAPITIATTETVTSIPRISLMVSLDITLLHLSVTRSLTALMVLNWERWPFNLSQLFSREKIGRLLVLAPSVHPIESESLQSFYMGAGILNPKPVGESSIENETRQRRTLSCRLRRRPRKFCHLSDVLSYDVSI